ncbi:DUF6527 family protein [Dyella sp.]|uniref:DUF6527 family protein n=1 Tax=Dyella sp. TaxID=1869338 RepID=UPI003F820B1E
MSKARVKRDDDGRFYGIEIRCPGCLYSDGSPSRHIIPIAELPAGEAEMSPHIGWKDRWTFNGDMQRPTFSPSLNTWWGGKDGIPLHRCHSFIREGRIEFLPDSTHALAGQTVELPEITE